MKSLSKAILFCVCFIMLERVVAAHAYAFDELYDSYILKYKYDDNIQIITAEEKNALLHTDEVEASSFDNNRIIEYIEPNYNVYLYDSEPDKEWNFNLVNSKTAWEYGCYGNEINIAVLDSGVSYCEGLRDSLIPGYNIINYSNNITDNIGHGTFVSGIISNSVENQYAAGIAPKAKIIPIKCFDRNYSTKADKIAEALDYVINNYDCDIINMSFGINGKSAYLESKINKALQKNIIIVSAVGNNGSENLRYPAAYDGVIGVGAIDKNRDYCSFSQHNSSVDVVAPGKNINGIDIGFSIDTSGTSYAAPHVSAAAAVAKCIDNDLSPEKFYKLIQQTSTDLGEPGYDNYYGYGLLDIGKMSMQIINENDIFQSPISIDNNYITTTICNNSQNDISCVNILSNYYNNELTNTEFTNLYLRANEKRRISLETESATEVKSFVWSDSNNIKPLTSFRDFKP